MHLRSLQMQTIEVGRQISAKETELLRLSRNP